MHCILLILAEGGVFSAYMVDDAHCGARDVEYRIETIILRQKVEAIHVIQLVPISASVVAMDAKFVLGTTSFDHRDNH